MLADLSDYMLPDQCIFNLNALQRPITFQPVHYDYTINKKQRKSRLLYLDSKDVMPRLLLSERVIQKATYHQQQGVNKKAFMLTNRLLDNATILLDGVSYDTSEGYARYLPLNPHKQHSKIENDELYGCLGHFLNGTYQPSSLVESLVAHSSEVAVTYAHDNIDLIYLNLFRLVVMVVPSKNGFQVSSFLYYPSISLEMCEIRQPNKLVETPLTKMITRQRDAQANSKSADAVKCKQYKFGFLTLDQSKRILPLMASDPIVDQLPLIGAWVYTNDPHEDILVKHHILWAMATEFVVAQHFKQKITNNEASFLFVVFQKYKSPVFFDTKLLNKSNQWRLVKQVDQVEGQDNHLVTFDTAQAVKIQTPSQLLRSPEALSRPKKLRSSTQTQPTESPGWTGTTNTNSRLQAQGSDTRERSPPKPFLIDSSSNNTNNTSLASGQFPKSNKTSQMNTTSQMSSQIINQSSTSNKSNDREQSLTQQLIVMQSEQLKMLQSQVVDLQRALINQSQMYQMPQYHHPPVFQMNPNQYHFFSPFYQKDLKQSQRMSVNAFPQMSNRQDLDSDSKLMQRHRTEYETNEVQQIKTQATPLQSKYKNLSQKLDFLDEKLKTQNSLKKTNQVEEIEDILVVTAEKKQPLKPILINSPLNKQSPQSPINKKQSVASLVLNNLIKNDSPISIPSNRQEASKRKSEHIQVLVSSRKSFSSQNKENMGRLANSIKLQESAQSKMPKIRFLLNNSNQDSDSDAEVKLLEMKYLNRNKYR